MKLAYKPISQDDEQLETIKTDNDSFQKSPKKKKQYACLLVGILVILVGFIVMIGYSPRRVKFDLTSIHSPWQQLMQFDLSYREVINAKTQLIANIKNSIINFECLNIKPMFHSFDYIAPMIYFTTFDEIIMPGCLNDFNYKWSVSRENIKVWNKEREVTEWALNHVKSGDKVLYYRPEVYNLAQITMLSKLVGPLGRVVTVGSPQLWKCMPLIRSLHSLPANIEYKEQLLFLSLEKYNIVIANDTVFQQNVKQLITNDSKMLIYSTDIDTIRTIFSKQKVQSFQLEDKECGKGVYGSSNTAKSGFFSFTADGADSPMPERRVFRKSTAGNKLLAALEHEYLLYKLEYVKKEAAEVERLKLFEQRQICRSPDSSRQGEGFVVTTYGHKLHGVSVEQLQEWEGEREAVEWLRSKQAFLEVYYEVGYGFNLLAIVEIAHLVRDSTLYVVCSREQCEEIEQQCSKSRLTNVVILHQTSTKQALLAGAVITDNEALIKELLKSDYDKDHALLGHFTHTRNESLKAMREIYVRHRLKEVFIPQYTKQCIGFQFLHPFWNHTHPHCFYEITPSKYVVYSFWDGPLEEHFERKSFLINEMLDVLSDVQIKLLTQQQFLFFQTKEYPIHPAFYLLTSIQKSDFVRFYLMHTYGGGYADVKHYHFDWKPYFQRLEKDPIRMAYGYYGTEIHIACHDEEGLLPKCQEIFKQRKNIIGNSQFVFKKDSPLTREWYNTAIKNLDNKLEALRQNPPQVPRQHNNGEFTRKDGTKFISKYPFRWAEISNEYLARAAYKYREYLTTDMPYVIDQDYRIRPNNNDY